MKEFDDDILYVMRFFTFAVVAVLLVVVIVVLGAVNYSVIGYELSSVIYLCGAGMLLSTVASGTICLVDLSAFRSLTNGFIKLCVVIDSLSNKGKK